ncbi:unnamed protein product [Macrosiphum euphorbiae]|uniref:UDP-glucuronosyltransferase n=2 Tax=Macrosiphum euphorbiae TaxID=13131 RepID=A0AAV0W8P2_9HEMI|nr:unnamed protein product [Macrosiphum euphorbiae]
MDYIVRSLYLLTVFLIFSTFRESRMQPVESANILAIETIAGKSHWNFFSSVLRSLTDKGHNVTVFTPITEGNRENYTEIDTSGDLPKKRGIGLTDMMKVFGDPIKTLWFGPGIARSYCDIIHGNERLKDILEGFVHTDFDVILIEPVWLDCMSYVAMKLSLPMIYVVPQSMVTFLEYSYLGHVPNPASVSNFMADHGVPKTFVQRFSNTALLSYSLLTFSCFEFLLKYREPKPYDVSRPVQPSVMFVNSHYITEASRSLFSNFVSVGGIHLNAVQNIPNDILDFIENSPHGVIYFTFGSVVSMSTLPDHIQNAFKEALAQVPLRVLWKYEGEMKDKPINVMTSKWFPQRDILAHPNVKLFISHGGISGVYEAVDAGVPVLGFPLFYDQPRNIDNLVEAGMGISMDLLTLQKDELLTNILELINNEKYMKNAKIVSDRFKDRPMSPSESVVYWTEYVIRHKGAPHLKSQALNLTWYQYFLLDVIFVIFIFISFVIFITYKLFKTIYYYFLKYSQTIKPKLE